MCVLAHRAHLWAMNNEFWSPSCFITLSLSASLSFLYNICKLHIIFYSLDISSIPKHKAHRRYTSSLTCLHVLSPDVMTTISLTHTHTWASKRNPFYSIWLIKQLHNLSLYVTLDICERWLLTCYQGHRHQWLSGLHCCYEMRSLGLFDQTDSLSCIMRQVSCPLFNQSAFLP